MMTYSTRQEAMAALTKVVKQFDAIERHGVVLDDYSPHGAGRIEFDPNALYQPQEIIDMVRDATRALERFDTIEIT